MRSLRDHWDNFAKVEKIYPMQKSDWPLPEFEHTMKRTMGSLMTTNGYFFLLLSHWEEDGKLQQNAGLKSLPWAQQLSSVTNQAATELATSFQAMLFTFLWRCHIPVWKLLSSWFFNSTCKGLGPSSSPLIAAQWHSGEEGVVSVSAVIWFSSLTQQIPTVLLWSLPVLDHVRELH